MIERIMSPSAEGGHCEVFKMNQTPRPTIWHGRSEIYHFNSTMWGTLLREILKNLLVTQMPCVKCHTKVVTVLI